MNTTDKRVRSTEPFDDWAEAHGITMTARQIEARTDGVDGGDWAREASHFALEIKGPLGTFSCEYSHMDATEPSEPELGDVLYSLTSDARGVDNALDFADWASEYGYDEDSRSSERIYRLYQTQASGLRKALGSDVFQELLELEEDEPCPYPTADEIRERFRSDVLPLVLEQYDLDDDIAIREAFNDWTDSLCKDGEITEHQYDTIAWDD